MELDKNLPMRDKLDFQEVLFSMLIQTMKEIHHQDAYKNNVRLIETTLLPYHDQIYAAESKKIDEDTSSRIKKYAVDYRRNREDSFIRDNIEQERTVSKLGALMKLARRKGLLPEETITHIMGEEM